jgi:hypothetical protein
MESLIVEGTKQTPALEFNAETGIFKISGRSIPENTPDFYMPIIHWLAEYAENPKEVTVLEFRLEYINTSSSKFVFEVIKKMEKLSLAGNDVQINWYYEEDDEDMMETGEDFADIVDIPIHLIEVEEL